MCLCEPRKHKLHDGLANTNSSDSMTDQVTALSCIQSAYILLSGKSNTGPVRIVSIVSQ